MPILSKLSRGFTGRGPRVDWITLGSVDASQINLDPTRPHIFIWVPGTTGTEADPAFRQAVDDLLDGTAQVLHVAYPADWNFSVSVPIGTSELKKLLRIVNEAKAPDQIVYLGGSSQGAWVISNVISDPVYRPLSRKTVLFGHPGVAPHHFHEDNDDDVWEVNDPKDAVTFGWDGKEQLIMDAINEFFTGSKILGAYNLFKNVLVEPKKTLLILELVLFFVIPQLHKISPHNYARQFPLAVYWLVH